MQSLDLNKLIQLRKEYFVAFKAKLGVRSFEEISELLDRRGYGDGASKAQLSNIQCGRRDASKNIIKGLQELAPGISAKVLGKYNPNESPLARTINEMISQTDSAVDKSREKFGDEVTALFRCLGEGDLYVLFLAGEMPAELRFKKEIKKAFVDALKRGATAIYIAPTAEAAWLSRQGVRALPLESDVQQLIMGQLSKEGDQEGKAAAKRVHVARVDLRTFIQPGFKFALYCSDSLEEPVATFGAEIGRRSVYLHMVLGPDYAERMCNCIRSLESYEWPVEIISALRAHHLLNENDSC